MSNEKHPDAVEVRDVVGDRVVITPQVWDHLRETCGAIGCVVVDGYDSEGSPDEIALAFDREAFVRIRDTVDALVARHDAVRAKG